jgi:hypothetical protein
MSEPIIRAEEVTPYILELAIETHDGWFANEPKIDWEDQPYGFWSRMEYDHDINLGDNNDTPAMRKIQKHIRTYRRTT